MSLRDRLDAMDHWLAKRIHGAYIRELDHMRDLLNRDDSAYPGACEIEGCHRVARRDYETESTSLRLCLFCGRAFQLGVFDDDVAVFSAPIEIEPTDAASKPAASSR